MVELFARIILIAF